jgi:hypothetical protein
MNPQPEPTDRAEVTKLANAVEEALADAMPKSFRDDNPDVPSWTDGSRIGTAPPVPQPGIPPQSRGAVDYAVRVLSTSIATALGSGSLSLVLYVSQWANPVVCGIVFGAPIGLAVPIAAIGSLVRRTKEVVQAAPPEIRNYYNGDVHVDRREIHARSKGVWVKNNNRLST